MLKRIIKWIKQKFNAWDLEQRIASEGVCVTRWKDFNANKWPDEGFYLSFNEFVYDYDDYPELYELEDYGVHVSHAGTKSLINPHGTESCDTYILFKHEDFLKYIKWRKRKLEKEDEDMQNYGYKAYRNFITKYSPNKT